MSSLASLFNHGRRDWRGRALVLLLCFALGLHLVTRSVVEQRGRPKTADTLVVYVFSNTDVEYGNNLRFFLQFGVAENDGCDYIVIIQTGEGLEVGETQRGEHQVASFSLERSIVLRAGCRGLCI